MINNSDDKKVMTTKRQQQKRNIYKAHSHYLYRRYTIKMIDNKTKQALDEFLEYGCYTDKDKQDFTLWLDGLLIAEPKAVEEFN